MQRLVPVSRHVQCLLVKGSQSSARLAASRGSTASLSILCQATVSSTKRQQLVLNASSLQNYEGRVLLLSNQRTGQASYSSANLPEHISVRLPALSPTMEQGTLAKWCVAEGEAVAEGDLIAEIETDKATMGLESSEAGFMAKIFVQEKTKDIPLRTLLCIMVPNESDIAAFKDFAPSDAERAGTSETAAPADAAPEPAKKEVAKSKPAAVAPPPPPTPAPAAAAPQQSAASTSSGQRVFASPLARKLADERNIDISQVQGTGPDREIRASDVLSFTAATPSRAPSASAATAAASSGGFEDLTLNNYRLVTAKRLLQSKQTIPHYYLSIDFELDNALKVRKDLNEQLTKDNMKVSVTDLVIKAAACACKKVPEANSAWMDTFIRRYNNVDINVAVATENGLITPIVFNADKKGLTSISFDVNSLAQKARANKLQPHEFMGGTFTVSNLGMFGVKNFSAVINPPQSCILAVGGAEKKLIPDANGGSRVATVMSVTLSCDHRVVDGAVGAKWLEHFKRFMENPATMLL